MENICELGKQDEMFELPPGFRFHPTDEELITHYLTQKVHDSCFNARAIGEVDLNKCEPWELPRRTQMGEKEWYFFCLRDRKYPTGLRTNRATEAGYWKATGKDKEIFKEKTLIGMKKTLVFYKRRAPKCEKSNWVMHEYRVESKFSVCNLPKTAENEWVLCRVFQKSSDRKKSYIPGLVRLSSTAKDVPLSSSLMPPLMESSPYELKTKTPAGEFSQVTCFSDPDPAEDQRAQDDVVDSLEAPFMASSSSVSWGFLNSAPNSSCQSSQMEGQNLNTQHPDGFLMQNQSMLRMLIEDNETNTRQSGKTGFSQESDHFGADISSIIYQECPSASAGPVDIGGLWDYRY